MNWDINHDPIVMVPGNTEMIESAYKYDPRVTFIEDRYWVTWCNGYHGPTIALLIPSISRLFINAKMHFYLLTEMAYFSLKRSMGNMPC